MTVTPAPGAVVSPRGPSKKAAIITVLVGLAITLVAGLGMGVMLFHRIFVTTYEVPGSIRVHLHEGTWNLYELSGNTDTFGPVRVDRYHGLSITPSMVSVEGPDGPVRVTASDAESIGRLGDDYGAAATFEAPVDGTYRITVDAPARTRVMVAPSIGDIFLDTLPWLIVGGVAAIVTLVGFVLLVVGATRRQRDRKRAWLASGGTNAPAAPVVPTGPVLPPPGWHPDPYGMHRLRWWDGRTWTDQISD